jgi:hypothetical protein
MIEESLELDPNTLTIRWEETDQVLPHDPIRCLQLTTPNVRYTYSRQVPLSGVIELQIQASNHRSDRQVHLRPSKVESETHPLLLPNGARYRRVSAPLGHR